MTTVRMLIDRTCGTLSMKSQIANWRFFAARGKQD
jgi:hypothetical protein